MGIHVVLAYVNQCLAVIATDGSSTLVTQLYGKYISLITAVKNGNDIPPRKNLVLHPNHWS